MKRKFFTLVAATLFLTTFIGCEKEDLLVPEKLDSNKVENANAIGFELPDAIQMPEKFEIIFPETGSKWTRTPHQKTMWVAAKQWGLSDTRADAMAGAAHMPDIYDDDGHLPGTQQWRHGYVYLYGIYIKFGIADAMCANNINGSGYNGKSAFYYYPSNKPLGDWYLGYASHYLQDVANPWHTSANIYQQISTHSGYETWVANNWTKGHKFQDVISADYSYYAVTDPAASTRNLALWSNNKNTIVYKAYVASDKPTGSGTGNTTLINETKELLKASCRYTKGLIKYTLDAKKAW
jgi:hypothetical protein